MNLRGRIWYLSHIMLIVLTLLSLRIAYWPLLRGDDLRPVAVGPNPQTGIDPNRGQLPPDFASLPQPVIARTIEQLRKISRGSIYDRNGNPLAYNCTNPDTDTTTRCYPQLTTAHVVGYLGNFGAGVDVIGPGVTGIEGSFNDPLLGLSRLGNQLGQMVHLPVIGEDIYLTIDSNVQAVATAALGNRAGAIVALNAHTGEVLALVSGPAFDPNQVNSPGYLDGLIASCGGYLYCQDPLFNRAVYGSYPPGSTWKTVTLIAALESGQVSPDETFYFGIADDYGCYIYRINEGQVINDCNHPWESTLDLTDSFAVSANVAFAQIGDMMPADIMIEYAQRFGVELEEAPPIEIGALAASLANDPRELEHNRFLRACTAIGQCQLQVSPLNMALIAAAVVNQGDIPSPYLVQEVRHSEAQEANPRRSPRPWRRNAMSTQTADIVRQMMIAVVDQGTGANAATAGLTVGGKTGTAENDTNAPHAWFIGFAEDEGGNTVAIAVIVEFSGEGSEIAAPIFALVADAAMQSLRSQ